MLWHAEVTHNGLLLAVVANDLLGDEEVEGEEREHGDDEVDDGEVHHEGLVGEGVGQVVERTRDEHTLWGAIRKIIIISVKEKRSILENNTWTRFIQMFDLI